MYVGICCFIFCSRVKRNRVNASMSCKVLNIGSCNFVVCYLFIIYYTLVLLKLYWHKLFYFFVCNLYIYEFKLQLQLRLSWFVKLTNVCSIILGIEFFFFFYACWGCFMLLEIPNQEALGFAWGLVFLYHESFSFLALVLISNICL